MTLKTLVALLLLQTSPALAKVSGKLEVPADCESLMNAELFDNLAGRAKEISSLRQELAKLFARHAYLCAYAGRDLVESRILSELQNLSYEVERVGNTLEELEVEFARKNRQGAEAAKILGETACHQTLQSQRAALEASTAAQKKENGFLRQHRCR